MANTSINSIIVPIVMLAILYVASIFFFHNVEKWDFLDAAYFTTVTLATVGYGDFTPITPLGKIGAMVLIFTGVSLAFYVITHIGLLREKTIDPQVQRRLEVLRNLTSLQTGNVRKDEVKKIKQRLEEISKEHSKEDKDGS